MLTSAPWSSMVYRRFSVDMHIPDWRPDLLGRFDPKDYVGCMAQAGVQSLVHHAKSHAGLCLWRTKVGGRMHANMKGRDFLEEVVLECRRRMIHPIAYFSLIFDNAIYEDHPDWRMTRADGPLDQMQGRYGHVCFNSPYRDYVKACIQEIVLAYDLDGVFFDMTFWPMVCYCPHCAIRFKREHHAELPRVVDWNEPIWRGFQQARQKWLLEFGMEATASVRKVRPELTVSHQYSTVLHNWVFGTPLALTNACDFVGGDFYGGATQHSLACKIFEGLTRSKPFEFHTSRTRIYTDHVTIKSMEEIRTEAFVATLHSSALMLIDYLNADGTTNHHTYEFLGRLSQQRAEYEPYLGGDLLADVAIYLDKESIYNPDENGVHITKLKATECCPHRDAVLGFSRLLQEMHVPFGVVTNANLDRLNGYRAVILPSVLELTEAQADIFRHFVQNGGALLASGSTSLDRKKGRFLLEDVLGVRYLGQMGTKITYLTPKDADLLRAIYPQDHLSFLGPIIKAEALSGAMALAEATLPFVLPELGQMIGSRFAAIHSDPPSSSSEGTPSVVLNQHGKGRAIWVAAPIEVCPEKVNDYLLSGLVKRLLQGTCYFEIDAHPAVEATLFHQAPKQRLLLGLLNLQRQYPQVPVGARVRVQIPKGKRIEKALHLPKQKAVPFTCAGNYCGFEVEPFESLAMFLIEYV